MEQACYTAKVIVTAGPFVMGWYRGHSPLAVKDIRKLYVSIQNYAVYGDNAMSDGMVRKCVRMFNEGRENVHDEARSVRPSLVNDNLVRKVKDVTTDVSQFLICPCTFLRFQGLYSMILSVVIWVIGVRIL